jgi:transposase
MAFDPIAALRKWKHKVAWLQQKWRGARREIEQLRQENEQLRRREQQLEQEREQLEREQERLRQENERLKRQLEEAQRASKRQAAPFSRGRRKQNPKTPGRKSGSAYGQRHSKAIPKKVDEVIAVPPPAQCACGGPLEVERIEPQYQQEIVRRTFWRRFDIPICRCQLCHKRVQGRDPRQTSDALGAAAVQLGPDALALAVKMNKGLGMPHADVAAVLQDGFQLQVNRSTICRAVDRVARRGEATWHALRDAARRSMVNGLDETGWNVAAQLRWLWVAVSEQVTFCDILPGRGFPQAASLLGADYAGWLTHDGWRVYYKFLRASHQSCLGHLLRRCEDMLKIASPAAARFPLRVQAVLQQGLALRDRYQNHEISLHGLWTATGRLEVKLDRVLSHPGRDAANRRLAKHLLHERPYLFTFLYCPGLDATNNVSERAIRALIGARKNWGGNRTPRGARAQAVLTSILQTARQQGKKPFDVLLELLCGRDQHKILTLVPPRGDIPQDGSPPDPPPRAAVAHRPPSPFRQEMALPLPATVPYVTPASARGALAPGQP